MKYKSISVKHFPLIDSAGSPLKSKRSEVAMILNLDADWMEEIWELSRLQSSYWPKLVKSLVVRNWVFPASDGLESVFPRTYYCIQYNQITNKHGSKRSNKWNTRIQSVKALS